MRTAVLNSGKMLMLGSMLVLWSCQAASPPQKPNIVFIMADDMGFGDVSSYNPESRIETPNMDQLASQGLRFTNVHTPSSLSHQLVMVCLPGGIAGAPR